MLSTVSAFWGLLLCAVYLYDIIGREAFNAPFQGTHELVANSIVGILFLELPSSIKRRAMIRTVFIFNAVSDQMRRILDCTTYILGILLFAAIIWGRHLIRRACTHNFQTASSPGLTSHCMCSAVSSKQCSKTVMKTSFFKFNFHRNY